MKIIDKIGVELEGLYYNDRLQSLISLTNVSQDSMHSGDGSITTSNNFITTIGLQFPNEVQATSTHEFQSAPLKTIPEIITFMKKFYPDLVNSSCGLHVHVSIQQPLIYAKFMEKSFYNFFIKSLRQYGERLGIKGDFKKRIAGESHFCRVTTPNFKEQFCANNKTHHRYNALNFCYGLHKTIEVRVLPMFRDIRLANLMVAKVVSIFEIKGQEFLQKKTRTSKIKLPVIEVSFREKESVFTTRR